MPNVRAISQKKYNITSHRFMELYHMCLQYPEWKAELKYMTDTVKSIQVTDMPVAHNGNSDPTQKLAMRRAELQRKVDLIEQTAKDADKDLWKYILKGVTEEKVTFVYLDNMMNIPCGKDMYYDRRRKFYWLLDKRV